MKRQTAVLAALMLAGLPLAAHARTISPSWSATSPAWQTTGVPGAALRPLGRSVALANSLAPGLAGARQVARIAPDRVLRIGLALRVRDQAGLDALVREEYTPGSTLFHQWISPETFAARFAPTAAQRGQIAGWLRSQGIQVTGATRNGLEVEAAGPAWRIERAFSTPIGEFVRGSTHFFANTSRIRVPSGLAGTIRAVSGLESSSRMRAHTWSSTDAGNNPVTPRQLMDGYNITPLANAGMHGEGQTIAIFQLTDFSDANIAAFDAHFGLPAPNLQRISVAGGTDANDAETEAELDIEVVHAVAPAAHLLVYEAPNGADGVTTLWNQIVSDDRAPVITVSYGAPESGFSRGILDALNPVLEEAAAQGQAVFNASGDDGAFDGQTAASALGPDSLQVDFPASSPWVTAVGGTELAPGKSGSMSEHVWSQPNPPPYASSGGGGGVSGYFKQPWYQTGPGVQSEWSNGFRQVPDVSALAGTPGYAIFTIGDDGTPGWVAVDGTSAATPLWASYATLVNQALGSPIGFLNPTLYLLGQQAHVFDQAPFNDITDGDNLHYTATPGWDFATGWGSMNGTALVRDIQSLGGPKVVHPVDLGLRAWVSSLPNAWSPLQTVSRRQTVYLIGEVSYRALPLGTLNDTTEFSLSSARSTVLHTTLQGTVERSQIGRTYDHTVAVKIPAKIRAGVYRLTVKYTLGGTTTAALTTVSVR